MKKFEIKIPEDILEFMKENIEYGWIDINGNKHIKTMKDFVDNLTNFGIEVVSLNLMLEEETQPVIWRGPVVADVVKQFWGKTLWKDIDVMFVDMPPGTGEVPLTVFQSIPLDGIVVVATPQELVGMIVEEAVNMANMMNVPVLGLIENMSYIKCPDCGKEIKIGRAHV